MTVDGRPVPSVPDVVRMRRERHAKLQHHMAARGVDALLLLGTSAVAYATGAEVPAVDSARAALLRHVAVVVRGADEAHLLAPRFPDVDDGAIALAAQLAALVPLGARVACDETPHALLRALRDSFRLVSASAVLGAAKVTKTPDELACIRLAQHLNEKAMLDVQPLARPGARQTDLSAAFLRRVVELGAANGIDPIWQVMPVTKAHGPWTVHGDLAFPTPSSTRSLANGDVVWVDTGIHVHGYASDFGRTWLVGAEPAPSARQQEQFERWRSVVDATLAVTKPGASALDLARAATDANGGTRPWIEHFYLAHAVGTDSAEMPMIGTDLGDAFDEQQVLAPGMVLVLEPVIWDDGAAGYRSEDVYAVTDDGWMQLSDHPYDPFVTP